MEILKHVNFLYKFLAAALHNTTQQQRIILLEFWKSDI